MEKAKKLFSYKNKEKTVKNLIEHIDNPEEQITKITLPSSDGYRIVQLSEIVYFEASNNYTKIYLEGCKHYIVSKTLKEINSYLAEVKCFLRIHKSYLVNMDKAQSYKKEDGLSITLCCGSKLPVSRRKKAEFLEFVKL